LKAGDRVSLTIPKPSVQNLFQKKSLSVLFEDPWIIVLDKPPGIVVHPAPGHSSGTLVHGLLNYCSDLSGIGGSLRPGIVHRLDKDTSGLMLVAKNDMAHQRLAQQFQNGTIKKGYVALIHGIPAHESGTIDLPISRHRVRRKEMAVCKTGGRNALTLWRKIADCKEGFSLLSVTIKTGRTHQIRVHFSHLGHPIVGDTVYGKGPECLEKAFSKTKPRTGICRQKANASRRTHRFCSPKGKGLIWNLNPLFPKTCKKVLSALKLDVHFAETNP
jgi:23S rRNA pseudouridine1911/1915/1917 synthase